MNNQSQFSAGRRDLIRKSAVAFSGAMFGGLHDIPGASAAAASTGNMHLSLSSYSFRQFFNEGTLDLFRFIEWTSKLGIPAVELTSYFFEKDFKTRYLRDLRRCAFDYGMTVSGCAAENNFCLPPGGERQREVDSIHRWIDHAGDLYAPLLRIFAGEPRDGVDRHVATGWVAECVRDLLDHAEECGVLLAMENHGPMTLCAADHLEIMNTVGDTFWFGITLDTGNYRTDVYDSIQLAAHHAVNVHFKTDVFMNNGPRTAADFKRIRDILVNGGYRGSIVLEYESRGNPYYEVPQHMRTLKQLFTA